jgi:hypothetical protein
VLCHRLGKTEGRETLLTRNVAHQGTDNRHDLRHRFGHRRPGLLEDLQQLEAHRSRQPMYSSGEPCVEATGSSHIGTLDCQCGRKEDCAFRRLEGGEAGRQLAEELSLSQNRLQRHAQVGPGAEILGAQHSQRLSRRSEVGVRQELPAPAGDPVQTHAVACPFVEGVGTEFADEQRRALKERGAELAGQ